MLPDLRTGLGRRQWAGRSARPTDSPEASRLPFELHCEASAKTPASYIAERCTRFR